MPPQQGQNISAKLAPLQGAFMESKDKEMKVGNMELPGGIKNGVAQLVDCKLAIVEPGKTGAGQVYFYAAGVVLEPENVGKVRVKGLRTSITSPVTYATPTRARKTPKEHLDWVINELKKLGADMKQLKNVGNLEAVCAALKKRKPYFNFSTQDSRITKERPDPMTFHNWYPAIADYVPGESNDAAVVDESAVVDPDAVEPTDTEAPVDETISGDIDLDALLASANDDDSPDQTTSQETLRAHAMSLSVTEEQLDEAADWDAIVGLINEAGTAPVDANAAADEPEAVTWSKSDVALYQPIDPKTKKPKVDAKKKPVRVECEVLAVDKKKETVDLKDLDSGKVIKAVPFDKLEVPS